MSFSDIVATDTSNTSTLNPKQLIMRIETAIREMNNHSQQISTHIEQLGTDTDNQQLRENLTKAIQLAHTVTAATAPLVRQLGHTALLKGEWKSEYCRIANQFQAASTLLDRLSRKSAMKQRQLVLQAQAAIERARMSNLEDADNEEQSLLLARAKQEQLKNDMQFTERMIQERESSIKQIEKSIQEVHACMMEIGKEVSRQAVTLDLIEDNLETTHSRVVQAQTELVKAEKRVKKKTKHKCFTLILAVTVIGLVVLIVVIMQKT
eukprot:TRINITY_DN67222_c3_g4_i1.p1 TRINITY_DN67222_c3_g4~~TRINITY_DN67222_c3_g4_i1.p1  ORF type:complete len:265 (+),score=34.18 TRINITY_DN67222_c3_g4_i1:44-838(+)